ncbi:MAG: hypothetical protein AAGL89_14220 [Pseudomonadota bacterium]
MFDIGDEVEFCGVKLKAVAFFHQPTVVLENENGERVTVALTKVIHNLMRQDRAHSKEGQT